MEGYEIAFPSWMWKMHTNQLGFRLKRFGISTNLQNHQTLNGSVHSCSHLYYFTCTFLSSGVIQVSTCHFEGSCKSSSYRQRLYILRHETLSADELLMQNLPRRFGSGNTCQKYNQPRPKKGIGGQHFIAASRHIPRNLQHQATNAFGYY